jgi:PPOX class probable F420-dependent enzyme
LSVPLPAGLLALLRRPSPCFVATVMPDGSPQLTQTWVSTDGEHILINVVDGMQKARNVARDPRVAVNIVDPDNTSRYYGCVAAWSTRPRTGPPTASTRSRTSTSAAPTRASVGCRRPGS